MAITPRFSAETEEAILTRILADIVDDVDKRQGSIAYDLTAPAAQELAQAYVKLDSVLSFAFINEDTPSDLLTLHASDFGVDRKASIKATGAVTLAGPIGQVVPQNTQVRTEDGVYFRLTSAVTLTTGTATTAVEAVLGGVSGNAASGRVNTIVGDLVGIVSVTNALAFNNGVDEESDAELVQRVYDKVRKPATSGNVYHYEQWAREVSGVGSARVYPLAEGPGTVRVVLLGADKRTPSQTVIDAAAAYIEGERPIGASVTVVGATEVPINISADLTLAGGATISEVEAEITQAVTQYLESLAFTDPLVRYTRVASILLDVPRIVDYENLLINSGTSNVEVTQDQVAVIGTVTLDDV